MAGENKEGIQMKEEVERSIGLNTNLNVREELKDETRSPAESSRT